MISFFFTLGRLLKAAWRGLKDPELRALSIVVIMVVASGTFFYWSFEDWGFVDALYFSVITLTTIGYGDLHPTSAFTKLFTVCYILVGLGIFAGFISKLAAYVLKENPSVGRQR